MSLHQFTAAQASVITGLPLSAIHKAMDTGLVRAKRSRKGKAVQRVLSQEQLLYLDLEAGGLLLLPLRERRKIAQAILKSPKSDALAVGSNGVLKIDLQLARKRLAEALRRIEQARNLAVSDPGIMNGTPVFKGTRIPVQTIASMHSQGVALAEILDGYPALNREMVELAPIYVSAFPRRGRPARLPWRKRKPVRNHQCTKGVVPGNAI